MEEKKLKYDRRDVERVYATALIVDHVPDVTQVGRAIYIKCPFCGEHGKKKSKMHGMKLTDRGSMHIGKCFDCGQSFSSAVAAEEYFGKCSTLEAIERCASTANIYLEPIADRRRRLAKEAAKNNAETFVSRQLRESGLTFADVMAKVKTPKGFEYMPVFTKGALAANGQINEDDDEMLIHYIGLDGHPVTYATRSNNTGLRKYVRVRWAFPSLHTDATGKEIKYQTPKGAKARFYIPQKIRDLYDEKAPIDTLIVQEGEKKAEKACKHGIPSIGIQGIYNIGNIQDGLMKELSYIVQTCKVKNVVLLFDSDWDHLSSELANGARVDQRPNQFSKAAIKFRNYVESLHNEGIHVDIWVGHLNSEKEKGIDDLLTGSLHGKEDDLSAAIDTAMHAHDGHSDLIDIHKISSLTDYQIRDFWGLNKFDDFVSRHSDVLSKLDTFRYMNAFYSKNDSGIFEPKTASGASAEFWDFEYEENGKKKVIFNSIKMIDFLSVNGFKRIRSRDTAEGSYDVVRVQDGILAKASLTEIKIYIAEFVSRVAPIDVYENLLNNFPKVITPDKIMTLPEIPDTTNIPEAHRQIYCYESGFIAVTSDGIETNAPGNLIWKESVIKRKFHRVPIVKTFDYIDGKYQIEFTEAAAGCEFLEYLRLTSNFWYRTDGAEIKPENKDEWTLHILNKMTCMGYLLHYFKPMNEAKAVIAMDMKESEIGDANGRTGKSLFALALSQICPQAPVDGKNFDSKFMFSSVTPRTRTIFIDDVNPNFNFESLYSVLTSTLVVNIKQGGIFDIPRAEAPKLLLSTNHAIRSDSKSTHARKILMGFSDFFNADYSIADHFGGRCFFTDEWGEDQWNLFDNFMMECCWIYLRVRSYGMNPGGKAEGLIPAPGNNLRKRELRQAMGEGFLSWALLKFTSEDSLGVRISRKDLYDSYLEADKLGGRYCNPVEFKKRIERFCEYAGYHLNPSRPHSKTGALFADWKAAINESVFIGSYDKSNGIEYFTITADATVPPKQADPFADADQGKDPFAEYSGPTSRSGESIF